MTPFAAPVEDILFSLEHVAGASDLPGWDSALVREIACHFAAFAETAIAPLDEPGDREGCRLENGRVRMPAGFTDAYRAFVEQGWPSLTAAEAFGGQGMSGPVHGAITEILAGACHSFQMLVGLVPGAMQVLVDHGTEEQRARFIPRLASGELLATMVLTEPGAGSDLAGIRTRAVEQDGAWRITGEKIFISGGDQDLSEGILHLVLARSGAPGEGTRGLSLFLCPSQLADDRRNAIAVTRIEEKLGLHASPTCQLAFDGAEAELIGRAGEGLTAMFTMMNHARLDVALQGVAHAARAGQIARAYAAGRRQGRGPDGPAVTIDRHPDVARMLDRQDALAIGGRALCHVALVALERGGDDGLADFLTPVCKVFCTEAGIHAADLGIQVLGGYGYLREYRVEQTLRDARITAIYEGTNGIQALALATRGLHRKGGASADAFERLLQRMFAGDPADAAGLALWRDARTAILTAPDPAEAATPFMALTASVAWHAAWCAIAARAAMSPDPDRLARLAHHVRTASAILARAAHAQLMAALGNTGLPHPH